MRAERKDGWLVLDDERLFKTKEVVDGDAAARLVQHGALVATLPWIDEEPDNFAWMKVPKWTDQRTARGEARVWLAEIVRSTSRPGLEYRWLRFEGIDGQTAVVLTPFE